MTKSIKTPVLVFDVNETLLDIEALAPEFDRIFGDAAILREWFAQLVLYSQTLTLSGEYIPFGALGIGALQMTADIHGRELTAQDIDSFKDRMGAMPAHRDAEPALTRLKEAGFRMVTLTNSPPADSPTPLEKAGIAKFFTQAFSVDAVRRFKPAPETYQHVASELGVKTSGLCLVACHLWDVIGAQAAGCSGAFVARPYNAVLPADGIPKPDIVAGDLIDLADELVARFG